MRQIVEIFRAVADFIGLSLRELSFLVLIGSVVALAVYLIKIKSRNEEDLGEASAAQAKQKAKPKKKLRVSLPSLASVPSPDAEEAESAPKKVQVVKPKVNIPKKEAIVTERTREELSTMISNVKSLSQETPVTEDLISSLTEEDFKDTELVQALAETLVSSVKSEESDKGKFSKMTVDASLVFDEADVDFFEKEFNAED